MDIWQEGKSLITVHLGGFAFGIQVLRLDCAYWTQNQDIVIVVSSSQVASWHMALFDQNIPFNTFSIETNTNHMKDLV